MSIRLTALAFLAATFLVPASVLAQQPAAAAAPAASEADRQLKALYEAYWTWRMREAGQEEDDDGGFIGGSRLPSVDPASQQQRLVYHEDMLARLEAIPEAQLSDAERINAAVFRTILRNEIADARFREWEMPFNSDSSFWAYLTPRQGLRDAEAYRRYIARMRDVPRYFSEQIANMRAGLDRGFSVPRATLAGRDESLVPFTTADPEQNPFYTAFTMMPDRIPEAERRALQEEAKAAIREAVVPAYAELLTFLRSEYMPRARTTLAATAMPDGQAYYDAQIREYTTLDLEAEQIHRIGLEEVARIRAEMMEVMRESGHQGSFEEFLHFLRTDPQFYARTPEELLMFSAWVAKRADGKLGETIGHLPRGRFTILPVPDAIAPFYTAGRGGLGSCLMNTHNLPSRPLYQIPALTLHECAPGHSFQAALAAEQDQGPAFRRYTYFSGYGEGWGLYTEWLGIGMGIYRTPYEHFGRLSYEMWRAARLVIDTGIHQYGWSRDRAIQYLSEHTALSDHEVRTEVDRYISWPGQALAYKLGEITIRRLRREAEQALGPRFDQRKFHDAILALGSVPLPVLEQRIARFIADGGENPPRPCDCPSARSAP